MSIPRVIALLATYNEERFIAGCLEHLNRQGVEVYLLDNESSDRTVAIAERYMGRGLIGIESLPRTRGFALRKILERKEELASSLEADWFMRIDTDEFRLPPDPFGTLAEAFAAADAAGYNAVNFFEFTFIPTAEQPDHDHPRFHETMGHYYPFSPRVPWHVKAWKRQPERVNLTDSAGHLVRFPGLRIYPQPFPFRHYLFLSRAHAVEKYGGRKRHPDEVAAGWGGWRNVIAEAAGALDPDALPLPSQTELRRYVSDVLLDPSEPLAQHIWAERWAAHWAAHLAETRS